MELVAGFDTVSLCRGCHICPNDLKDLALNKVVRAVGIEEINDLIDSRWALLRYVCLVWRVSEEQTYSFQPVRNYFNLSSATRQLN